MGDVEHGDDKDEYKVPTKVGLNDLLERDKDDAALESYKKQLLGTQFYSRTCLQRELAKREPEVARVCWCVLLVFDPACCSRGPLFGLWHLY